MTLGRCSGVFGVRAWLGSAVLLTRLGVHQGQTAAGVELLAVFQRLLKCGGQEINLDSAKERFSLTSGSEIFQGRAMFSAGQINFEFTLIL